MLNFGDSGLLLLDPDGTIGGVDRQHLLGLYSGIAATTGVARPGLEFTLPVNWMHHTLDENKMHHELPVNRMQFTVPEDD